MTLRKFPWEYQMDAKDCGFACLKIVSKHFKLATNNKTLYNHSLRK